MSSYTTNLLLLFFCAIYLVSAVPQTTGQSGEDKKKSCPKDEVWEDCGMTCKESCNEDLCKFVKMPCKEGCFCKDGFARIEGKCKDRTKMCAKKCPPHSTRKTDNRCADLCNKEVMLCLSDPIESCFCDTGYVKLEENGTCVDEIECKEQKCQAQGKKYGCQCPGNSPCDDHPTPCIRCEEGCYCEKDFFEDDGICIPKKFCPKKPKECCPPNMTYMYGNNCTHSWGKEVMNCERQPKWLGCFCNEGLYFFNGDCLPFNKCLKCPKGAKFEPCVNPCDNLCPEIGVSCKCKCYPGCVCEEKGYILEDGRCVKKEDRCDLCTEEPSKCPKGKVWNECGNQCMYLCPNIGLACKAPCKPGCWCPEGQVEVDGKCIDKERHCATQCPLGMTYKKCGDSRHNECPNSERNDQADGCTPGCYCDNKEEMAVDYFCVDKAEYCI